MGEHAHYMLCRYIPDLFRYEPRNVGVVVERNGQIEAKFRGETEPGHFDNRKLRWHPAAPVYRQWVRYWRRILDRSPSSDRAWAQLVDSAQGNYEIRKAGEVGDTEWDNLSEVVSFLYSMLVTEGGYFEALGGQTSAEGTQLKQAIQETLEGYSLFRQRRDIQTAYLHPIEPGRVIYGRSQVAHQPTFMQDNGVSSIIEPVDLRSRKGDVKYRAAYAAYMFEDVGALEGSLRKISVIRTSPDVVGEDPVEYSKTILRRESDEMFDWSDEKDREQFLKERRKVAEGEPSDA